MIALDPVVGKKYVFISFVEDGFKPGKKIGNSWYIAPNG
jgi:hypothetical protein